MRTVRFLLVFLALSVIAGTPFILSSCTPSEKPPVSTEDNGTNAQNENTNRKTINLNSSTAGIKMLGVRNLESDSQINCDWSCSGIEFMATCEGDMKFSVSSSNGCYFKAYIDGEVWNNGSTPYYSVNGNSTIILKDIPSGKHIVKLIKVTGYTLANAQIYNVTLNGNIESPAPSDKQLYIEFVGDSTSCGWGVIKNDGGTYDGSYQSQDGTLAYPYLIAEALDADYSITALSGQGLIFGTPGMTLGYKYACYAKDPTHEYSFNRKADMVVINIGTNDFSKSAELGITSASFSASFKSFIEYVRQKNGDDCIILSLYNMMNDTFGNEICNTIAELGGADNGLYTYFVDRSINEAALNHPSESKYVSYAAELIPLIRSLLDGTYTAPEEYISKLPANSVVVNPAFSALADGTETKFTIGSSEYTVVIGQDAFDNLTQAHNKVNENGTIYLSDGTYSETFYIKKNITIYGPKAGINPNVRGQTETDDWTLNSERGVGEAIITGNWGLGVWGDTVYPDCHKIIIDGVQFSAGVLMRQNSGNAGYCDIKLMNIYATNITTTNQVIFFYPYYPSTSNPNAYARTLKMENFRIEGLVKSFCRLACTSFEASGIYMSEDCSVAFLDALATDKVSSSDLYIIKDSMFRNKNATVFKLNFMSGEKYMDGIGAKSSVTFQIEGCVFAENSTSASSPAVIVIGRNTGNVSVSIKNNMFTSTVSSCRLISDSISAPGDYSKNTVVSGNTFTGIISPFDLTKSTAPIDVSSNTIK